MDRSSLKIIFYIGFIGAPSRHITKEYIKWIT
jgi:hypothetical protein